MKTFATRTDLYPHQQDAVNKLLVPRVGALFADMGTGKTRMLIELVRRRSQKIDKVIYFCPVSLKATVVGQLKTHTDIAPERICVFDDKTSVTSLPKSDWYIVGIESMSSSARVVSAVLKLITASTYVVVDESSYIKGHNAMRTRRITRFCEGAKYRTILTGTPISQGIEDLYAQMRFLSPKILGYNSFYSFAANHLEYSTKHPGLVVRAHNTKYIAAKIQPYVYQITKEECLTLPEKLFSSRYFYMTSEQRDWYQRVKDEALEMLERYDSMEWLTSRIIFKMFTELQQVTSGFIKRRGELIQLPNPRLETLLNAVQDIPNDAKVIIFGKYQYDVDQIQHTLANTYGQDAVTGFDGRVNTKRRNQAVDKFRAGARFLVVTQSIAGHGFNFQDVAHYTIFYNNGFKYSEREQSEDRTHRMGQVHRPTYIDLRCMCGIEDRIFDALRKKNNLVDDFRSQVEKVKKDKVKELIEGL